MVDWNGEDGQDGIQNYESKWGGRIMGQILTGVYLARNQTWLDAQ